MSTRDKLAWAVFWGTLVAGLVAAWRAPSRGYWNDRASRGRAADRTDGVFKFKGTGEYPKANRVNFAPTEPVVRDDGLAYTLRLVSVSTEPQDSDALYMRQDAWLDWNALPEPKPADQAEWYELWETFHPEEE